MFKSRRKTFYSHLTGKYDFGELYFDVNTNVSTNFSSLALALRGSSRL